MSSLTRPALCVRVCYSVVLSTSMSITLEQGSSIATFANLKSDDVEDLIRVMRVAGVRRDNVGKNIGARRYAFNGLQVRVWQCLTHAEVSIIVSKTRVCCCCQIMNLPKAYRPPEGCAGAAVS